MPSLQLRPPSLPLRPNLHLTLRPVRHHPPPPPFPPPPRLPFPPFPPSLRTCPPPQPQLRRIFGADVVESVDQADAAQRRRQAGGGVRGGPARRRAPKKGLLVLPKEHWPPYEAGLAMEYVGEQQRGEGGGPAGRSAFKVLACGMVA